MNKYFLSLLLALTFFITCLLTLSDYGISWDSSLHFLRGQAYFKFLTTGEETFGESFRTSPRLIQVETVASRYYTAAGEPDGAPLAKFTPRPLPKLEFEVEQKASGQKDTFFAHPDWNAQFFLKYDGGHPPLINILSAFSNKLFYQTLNLLSDIESYQLIYILFSSIGVFVVSAFAKDLTHSTLRQAQGSGQAGSWLAGIVAGLSLVFFPLFFAEAHFNSKDPEQAAFFAGAVWSFWHWIKSGKLAWFGVFGGFVALASAVKWNIAFLPFIILPWLFIIRFKNWGRLGRLGVLEGLGVLLFLIITWPAAWFDPVGKIFSLFSYYFQIGVGPFPIQPSGFMFGGFNLYPLLLILTQTPEIILILGGIGVFSLIREGGGKLKVLYLLLLWLLVPLLRISLPNVWFYGGLRQIMEIVPAMAILVGIGAEYISAKCKVQSAKWIIVCLVFIALIIPTIRLHPNQNAYFNFLAGGLRGAMDKNLVDWTLTYGNIYKQAVLWLNDHAQKDANLAHLNGTMFAIPLNLLRPDISISPNHFSGFEQKGEYIIDLVDPLNPAVFAYRYPDRFLKSVHQIKVLGVAMVNIYKNDLQYSKKDRQEESSERIKVKPVKGVERDYFEVDLGTEQFVTRMTVGVINKDCALGKYELIAFRPQASLSQKINPGELYNSNEMKPKGEGQVEYLFPGELARVIQIFPQDERSCFLKGRVTSVSFLKNE